MAHAKTDSRKPRGGTTKTTAADKATTNTATNLTMMKMKPSLLTFLLAAVAVPHTTADEKPIATGILNFRVSVWTSCVCVSVVVYD